MSDTLKISVIMPCYNCLLTVDESIGSVLDQSYRNLELILVNDGSTDNTLEYLTIKYGTDPRIKIVAQPNGGVSSARNNGVTHSTGELVAFLDSDDLYVEGKLERQIELLQKTECDMVFGDIQRFEDVGSERQFLRSSSPPKFSNNYFESVITMDLFSYANFSTGIFRRTLVEKYKWNEIRRTGEDWELWIKLAAAGYRAENLPEITNWYRKHPNNTTKKYFELMTLEAHVSIINESIASKATKKKLIKSKIEYYSNIIKNRPDVGLRQCASFLLYCLRYPRDTTLKALGNISVAFVRATHKRNR